ncbi:hypothetical protein [Zunongwangia sp. HGR-M22]|uniref:hypothetical protein n=1 Tax=Zunongwangia sp. HGR-M22 TaxID=3015168 RepID=UPI0022DDEE17|nr:hypothetical protein [Zunongwangia sp. HGR-M22]WBL26397.1 hypothetical protein PBT91_03775 [Zunongwangia sp. HGR-M22]
MNNLSLSIADSKEVAYAYNLILKKGIWLYFILLLFEGALRKWVFPSLSAPLLIVRDPIAIWLIYAAWKRDLIPYSSFLVSMVFTALLSLTTTFLTGHGNMFVALYGARILILHFPLIFIIGEVFTTSDVVKVGKVMLWLSIPMTILIALQFYSPQSAWVNRGVGGDMEGAGFSGAMGYFRPPGTFSFTTGNTMFYAVLAAFIFYFFLERNKINIWLLIFSAISLFIAIPLSISRTLLFQVVIAFFFACMTGIINRKFSGRIVATALLLVIALSLIATTEVFQKSTEVFSTRIESASKFEGGIEGTLLDRYLGGLLGAIEHSTSQNLPFFGYGLGLGTNAGSMMLTGETTFLIAEEEWGRLVGEMGILFGLAVIFIRLGLCVSMTLKAYAKLVLGQPLAWMLLSIGLLIIPQGQWAQPTALGFGVLVGGFIMAAINSNK